LTSSSGLNWDHIKASPGDRRRCWAHLVPRIFFGHQGWERFASVAGAQGLHASRAPHPGFRGIV